MQLFTPHSSIRSLYESRPENSQDQYFNVGNSWYYEPQSDTHFFHGYQRSTTPPRPLSPQALAFTEGSTTSTLPPGFHHNITMITYSYYSYGSVSFEVVS